jgi:hypothetical protein
MLTKRTIVEPITKTITAEQLAKVMHRADFRHFGLPRKLISVRDPRFMSDFWKPLFRAVGTKLNISTSYHPQTDGQTERVNQTWEQVIRCYMNPLHDDWVQHLTNVEFAINAAVSTSTTMSPFKATLGFELTSPTTATFEDNEPSRTLPISDFVRSSCTQPQCDRLLNHLEVSSIVRGQSGGDMGIRV